MTVRAPQDAAAGLFLLAFAAFALWQGASLNVGTLGHFGPGMLPRALGVLTGLCGLIILIGAFTTKGAALERWSLRGPLAILGAVVAFGLAIRPLGLTVAGPLAMVIGSLGEKEIRWAKTCVFGLAMTAFCVILFRYLLNLPIPVAPWLIGY